MSRDRTKAQQDPRSSPARLPALHNPVVSDPVSLGNFLLAVKEILEVLTGARGSGYDKVVTHRELIDLGLGGVDFVTGRALTTRPREPNTGELLIKTPGGFYSTISAAEFASRLRSTKLFQDLIKSLDDPTRFDDFPERVKAILLPSIAAEARARGAEIRRLESTLQTTRESLASVVQEVTASVNSAAAGVRETVFAYANQNKAVAGKVTQLEVRLDDVDGQGVKIEEVLYGKADNSGLMGQWTLKMNAGGAIAGVGLSATDNEAGPDSAFIVMANRFAVVSPSYTGGLTTDPDNMYIPFGVDSSGAYVNGSLRINADGPTLAQLTNQATGVVLTSSNDVFKIDEGGTITPSTITLTATLGGLLSGFVTWTASGYSGSLPAAGTSNTATINPANIAGNSATFTATLTVGSDTYSDTITILKLRDGADSYNVVLTNESHTIPATPAGAPLSFANASGEMRVYKGATRLTSGVTYSIQANPSSLVATINASGAYSITGAGSWGDASTSTTITFRATVTATGQTIDKVFTLTKALQGANGANGTNGQRGTVMVSRQISGSSWSDSEANTAISAWGYGSPQDRDMVTLYNPSASPPYSETRFRNGSSWSSIAMYVGGNVFIDGTIAASKLAAGQVTTQNAQGFAGFGVAAPNWGGGSSLPVVLSAIRTQTDRPALHVGDNSDSAPPSGSYWVAEMWSRANGLLINAGQGVPGLESVALRIDARGKNAIYTEGPYADCAIRAVNTNGMTGAINGSGIYGACLSPSGNGSGVIGSAAGFGAGVTGSSAKGPGVEGYSDINFGGLFRGNATRAAIRLLPRATLPSQRDLGSLCCLDDGNLYFANGSHWFRVGGMVQVT